MRKKEYYAYNKGGYPGGGTRYKGSSRNKNMPKEMYPIVDKPTIQFIVEEAVAAGITDILIITNRGKGLMEDHLTLLPNLKVCLKRAAKQNFLKQSEIFQTLQTFLLSDRKK